MAVAVREIVEEPQAEYYDDDVSPGEDEEFVELDPDDEEFVHELTLRILVFLEVLCDIELHPYEKETADRVVHSVLANDGAEITVLWARQSGKSTTLACVIATLMLIMPKLALTFPERFGQYRKGFEVGIFAPTEDQALTVWGKVWGIFTSKHGKEILADEDIEEIPQKEGSKVKVAHLVNCGSLCRMQTANPKAQIESKTYHFVLLDESQDIDSGKAKKSIFPMLASTNGTKVFAGTTSRVRNFFYDAIRANQRRALKRGARQDHWQYDYKIIVKFNKFYKKYIAGEKERLGEDSDEFRMAYLCHWLLEQGMFITEEALGNLADPNMETWSWFVASPCVAGVDPARTKDSTVVTVMWVDWENPDPYGYCQHRILAWLEISKKEWEIQYALIIDFLSRYNIIRVGVDAQGMGSAVAERLAHEMPWIDVQPLPSDPETQETRWKRLRALCERRMFVYPSGPRTRRTRPYKKFIQQFIELEQVFSGKRLLAAAPEVVNAYDDYCDSSALAVAVTEDSFVGAIEEVDNMFYARRGA